MAGTPKNTERAKTADAPPVGLAAFYNVTMGPRGFRLPPHLVPVCMGLEDRRIPRLICISGPGNGKSTLTSQVYPNYRISVDPASTILAISSGEALMQGFQQAVQDTIMNNPSYKKLFPAITPDKSRGWSNEKGLFVLRETIGDPDASYFACGLSSKALTGKHAREIIIDDIHDEENSLNVESCEKVVRKFYTTILGRADPRGARFIISGRRWHTNDVYGSFEGNGDWLTMVLPAERPSQERLWWDAYIPRDLKCVFTENYFPEKYQPNDQVLHYKIYYGLDEKKQGFFWPKNSVKRTEYFMVKRNQPAVAEATYQCNPNARENAPFVGTDFLQLPFLPTEALREGVSSLEVQEFLKSVNGRIVQSWDTATGKSSSGGYSVCVTGILAPSQSWWRGEDSAIVGKAEQHNRVYILDVWRERVDFPSLSKTMNRLHKKWQAAPVLIEDRSTGRQLIQIYRAMGIPIREVKANQSKLLRAVNTIGSNEATAQAWFRQHRVVLPEGVKWIKDYITEFLDFTGSKDKKNDQVDATVHLLNYAIGSGIGQIILPEEPTLSTLTPSRNRIDFLASLGMPENAVDPLEGFCGRCGFFRKLKSWCKRHKMPTMTVSTCYDYEARMVPESQDYILDEAEEAA